jgi:hypothetical protein
MNAWSGYAKTCCTKGVTRIAGLCLFLFATVSVADVKDPAEVCGVIHTVEGKAIAVVLPSLHVIETTAAGAFVLPKDAPAGVSAVRCGRPSLVPEKNDFKVLQGGFVLFIVSFHDERVAVLEIVGGRLQYRAVKGELTSDEIPRIKEFLSASQPAFNKSPAEMSSSENKGK